MTANSSNNLVSIIIPAYNAEHYLDETIQSVINQSYQNWELLIVNDGSKDNTQQIAEKWAKNDKRIFLINKPNSGVSNSRNTGIKHAQGDYIFFLDADDIWNPNNIDEKVKKLSQADCFAVYSACELINEDSKSINDYLIGSDNISLEDLLQLKGNYITAPSGIAVKRDVINAIQGFDTNLSNNADQDFFIRILAKGYNIRYIKDILWKYRMHSQSMSKNIALLEKDILYVFNKASKNTLFKSIWFKQSCFANVYLTLAGSWWKNGNNKIRGIYFMMKALFVYPPSLIKLFIK